MSIQLGPHQQRVFECFILKCGLWLVTSDSFAASPKFGALSQVAQTSVSSARRETCSLECQASSLGLSELEH